MSDVKKIGTIQEDSGDVELFGVRGADGRWYAARGTGENLETIDSIPSEPTFGQIKQATAQRFANPSFAFDRHQPSVDGQAETPEVVDEAQVEPEPEAAPEPAPEEPVAEPEAPDQELAEPAVEPEKSEAEMIRDYMTENPKAANKDVVAAFAEQGVEITSSQVSAAKRQLKDNA